MPNRKLALLKFMQDTPTWHSGAELIHFSGVTRRLIYNYLTDLVESELVERENWLRGEPDFEVTIYRARYVRRAEKE